MSASSPATSSQRPVGSSAPALTGGSRVVMSDSDSDDHTKPPTSSQPQESTPAAPIPTTKLTAAGGSDSSEDEGEGRVARRAALKRQKEEAAAKLAAANAAAAAQLDREEQERWSEFEAFVASTSAAVLPSEDDLSTGTPDIEEGQWSTLDKDDAGREEVVEEHSWAAPWSAQGTMSVAMPGMEGYYEVPASWTQPPPVQPQAAAFAAAQGGAAAWPTAQPAGAAAGAGGDPDVAKRMQAAVGAPAFNPANSAAAPRRKRAFNPNAAAFDPGSF